MFGYDQSILDRLSFVVMEMVDSFELLFHAHTKLGSRNRTNPFLDSALGKDIWIVAESICLKTGGKSLVFAARTTRHDEIVMNHIVPPAHDLGWGELN